MGVMFGVDQPEKGIYEGEALSWAGFPAASPYRPHYVNNFSQKEAVFEGTAAFLAASGPVVMLRVAPERAAGCACSVSQPPKAKKHGANRRVQNHAPSLSNARSRCVNEPAFSVPTK